MFRLISLRIKQNQKKADLVIGWHGLIWLEKFTFCYPLTKADMKCVHNISFCALYNDCIEFQMYMVEEKILTRFSQPYVDINFQE